MKEFMYCFQLDKMTVFEVEAVNQARTASYCMPSGRLYSKKPRTLKA